MVNKLSDVGAERAVLAGIFQFGNECLADIQDIIDSKTFTIKSNQLIYECVKQALKNNPKVDISVFLSAAKDLGASEFFEDKTEIDYIRSLFNFPLEKVNVRPQAKKMKKLQIARLAKSKLVKAMNAIEDVTGNETVDQIISVAEKPIFELINESGGGDEQPKLIGEGIHEYVQYLKSNPNRAIGIPTGFAKFDEAIGGGLRRKTVNLACARVKVGKSTFADNVGIHVSYRLGIPVLMIDTEMNTTDHHDRLLSYFAKVNGLEIQTGRFVGNKYKEEKVDKAANIISKLPYTYKNVSGKEFEEILAIIRRWVYTTVGFNKEGTTNNCLIIYDYFKLMNDAKLEIMQETQALGFQISALHDFCVEMDVPILTFAQVNRDGIDNETTAVIGKSDRLAELATSISLFKRKSEEEIGVDGVEHGDRKLVILETRHGAGLSPENYISMHFQGQYAMIEEGQTKAQISRGVSNSGFNIKDGDTTTDNSTDGDN